MDILLIKGIQDQVLDLFKNKIPVRLNENWKEIPLELDYDLSDTFSDDLHGALDRFEQKFNAGLPSVRWSYYFPWENTPTLIRWFKVEREDVEKTRKPLIIKVFAESAKTDKWLYGQQPQAVVVTRFATRRQNNIDGERDTRG